VAKPSATYSADGAGAFGPRKPGAHDIVVGRKTRGFEQAQGKPPAEQGREAGDGRVHQGRERPAGDGGQIDQPGAEPIQGQPAGNLGREIAPGKSREYPSHGNGRQIEFLGNGGRGDADDGAVEIIDHHPESDQGQDHQAHMAGFGHLDRLVINW
jgi:hypothetical protein